MAWEGRGGKGWRVSDRANPFSRKPAVNAVKGQAAGPCNDALRRRSRRPCLIANIQQFRVALPSLGQFLGRDLFVLRAPVWCWNLILDKASVLAKTHCSRSLLPRNSDSPGARFEHGFWLKSEGSRCLGSAVSRHSWSASIADPG